MDDKNILIKATNITQSFKVGEETLQVLKPISFNIHSSSFNIIYGPSGSGKSTLLNILSGIQSPSTGDVYFEGDDIYTLSPEKLAHFRANRIGIVYQQNYWVSSLSVLENVAVPLHFLGYSRKQAAKQAMDALQRVDMAPYAKKNQLVLSGGEQQRVAMARAIVHNPMYIIADEPTGNLDSKNGDMIMALLESYNRDLNRTIILVTHNIEYLPLGDFLIHIQDGQGTLLENKDALQTTDRLMREMKQRIIRLSKVKQK